MMIVVIIVPTVVFIIIATVSPIAILCGLFMSCLLEVWTTANADVDADVDADVRDVVPAPAPDGRGAIAALLLL